MLRLYDKNEGQYVSFGQLMQHVRDHRRPDGMAQPLLFWGSAGIGKTMRVRHFCAELGLKMKIYLPAQDNTGADIVGERMIDTETKRTIRVLPEWIPDAERDGPEGVLFVDEINRAEKSVRDGLLELMGDGTIMQVGYQLPPGWSIVAAANPADIGHDVYDIDDAMVDRFLHVAPGYDAAVWAAWADGQETMHPSVIDYALSNPDDVDAGEVGFPVALQDRIKPTPRAWANLGFLVNDETDEAMLRVLALGMLGREIGDRFINNWTVWQQGKRPLRFEQLFNRDEYEAVLSAWASSPEAIPLVEASNERIIAALMELTPDEDVAMVVGRYLARIPQTQSQQFFVSADRAIPDWMASLEANMRRWQEALNNQTGDQIASR